MNRLTKIGLVSVATALLSTTAFADNPAYSGFPVTVKGYSGDKTTSVAYTGQIARQALHDSLKKLAGKGNGQPNPELKAQLMSYFEGKDAGRAIIAPKTKGDFVIAETDVDSISKKKNLAGKTFKGVITGMPNGMTGPELVSFWIDKASSADKGVDLANGYNYPQLISKFLMGAVMYNQAVDNYLDEKLEADKKPNDKPYSEGKPYTGKEHAWDEAFGYFGAPANALNLTPKQVYSIAKQKAEVFAAADVNGDGRINLKSEMVFGPAYYAAGSDKGGKTNYLHTITKAFIDGRQLIADAKGEKLTEAQREQLKKYASVIEKNWEKVLAEATFKYAGSVYKDMQKIQTIKETNGDTAKAYKAYVKHWGELKGFALALQTGRNNLGGTATDLNNLIGYSPMNLDGNQVTAITNDGTYLGGETMEWGVYMLHMARVQKLLADTIGVEAKANDITGEIAALTDQLGDALAGETD